MSTFVCMCMYIWHLRVISICYCLLLQELSVQHTHTYILYIYKMMCSYVDSLASTGFAYSMLNRKYELWYVDENLLCSVFVSQRECVCVSVSVSVHVFYSFAQEQEGDASDVLYFHSGVLLWGKRIPWKLNISLWLAADKDWIICVLLKSPFNFFFNRDERFCLQCPGSCVPCCLVISEINSSTSPSCA